MSYPIKREPLNREVPYDQHCAGDWWYAEYFLNDDGSRSKFLGSYYYEHNAHRLPIMVVLPGGCEFCVDNVPSRELNTGGAGWTVSGSPEDGTLTVSPSIKVGLPGCPKVRDYHGFLTNGELTDDLEGNAGAHVEWNSAQAARRMAV